MMKDSWWLKAAVSDDRLVADLLLRLKDYISDDVTIPLPPSWGLRQPRSSADKSKDTPPRKSPTTPLSFGSASPSDGCEDSSGNRRQQKLIPSGGSQSSDRVRSKVSVANETPAATSKRPRKKKTFAELKEEESSLLKERTYLKKELATLRLTLKEQRSTNWKLKRIKLDLGEKAIVKPESNSVEQNSDHNRDSEVGSSNFSRQVKTEDTSNSQQKGLTFQDPVFVLPDLNMTPDEETSMEGIVGTLS